MRKIRVLDNVYDLITINMEDCFKDNVAFRFYDTANDAVTTILYKDYVQDIRKAVNYFQSTIPEIKGKKICLLTKNSYEYAVNTFGVVAAGAVLVLLNQRKSWEFFDWLLENCGVVGTPGVGFGECGEGYFRLTAFGDAEKTKVAAQRIKAAIQTL